MPSSSRLVPIFELNVILFKFVDPSSTEIYDVLQDYTDMFRATKVTLQPSVQHTMPIHEFAPKLAELGDGPYAYQRVIVSEIGLAPELGTICVEDFGDVIDLAALLAASREKAESVRALRMLKKARTSWRRENVASSSSRCRLVESDKGKESKTIGKQDIFNADEVWQPVPSDSEGSDSSECASHHSAGPIALAAAQAAEQVPRTTETEPTELATSSSKQHLDDIIITDEHGTVVGSIKIDRIRYQFNAHCCQLGPPHIQDHRTLQGTPCRLNRVAAKKPLGFLIQWLRDSEAYANRKLHKDSQMMISAADCSRCREWLQVAAQTDPQLEKLLRCEAEFLGVDWVGFDTIKE